MELPDLYKNSRILIVDDNAANIFLLRELLSDDGFEHIVTTTDPIEAIQIFKSQRFDIMLLDIQMPKLDGFGVLKSLREYAPNDYLPVVVLTAQQDNTTRLRALSEGAKDFLTKPFNNAEVLQRVYNLLEMRTYHSMLTDENVYLEHLVAKRTREIERTRLEIINRLSMASELRDTETGQHILRIGQTSHLLAKELGLDDNFCKLILHASPMHDVGKIGIPDHILLKPGQLDPEELVVMKTHAQIGADILKGDKSPLLKMAHDIALTHHEKWDGSGYPNGLAGQAIPIEGRITTICDVFDALSSERPYKKAWNFEDSLAYIKENCGSHFDPEIRNQFEKSFDDICQIKTEIPDPVFKAKKA
ncbi:HD domain-containing phosphohydrolase [Paremcibacter congregatus]|uniref:HD domain-containing phosphohydrolase n=1 Tax=Paremcibacter congregatus TaxID=2043170 RepID=UPI0030EBFE66|tara:strand:+ start:4485 stop:5567 length:1083 start_codon:yes stop_codon:yes gene_type:complete